MDPPRAKRLRGVERATAVEQLRALLHRGRISNDGLRELLTVLQKQNINLEDAAKQGIHRDAFLDRTRRM